MKIKISFFRVISLYKKYFFMFDEASKKVMVSSTKGNIGHLLGAAGGVEAVICVKAIENGIVPPTINYKEKDEECDLDIVPNEPIKECIYIINIFWFDTSIFYCSYHCFCSTFSIWVR